MVERFPVVWLGGEGKWGVEGWGTGGGELLPVDVGTNLTSHPPRGLARTVEL